MERWNFETRLAGVKCRRPSDVSRDGATVVGLSLDERAIYRFRVGRPGRVEVGVDGCFELNVQRMSLGGDNGEPSASGQPAEEQTSDSPSPAGYVVFAVIAVVLGGILLLPRIRRRL